MKHSENIRKRKDGRWEARYTFGYDDKGKPQVYSVYGKSYKEVKRKKQESLDSRRNGWNETIRRGRKASFLMVEQEWLAFQQMVVKPSTFMRYCELMANHILPYWGNCPISMMTTQGINAFLLKKSIDGRLDGKGGLSPKSIRDIASLIRCVMGYGYKEGYLKEPCDAYILPNNPKREMRVLSQLEQKTLEKCLLKKECKDNAALGIRLCLYTGIRIGELCALKWSAIDLTHGIIRIRETLQRIQQSNGGTRVIISTPKTHHSLRDIPIPKILIQELRQCTDLPQHYFLSGSVKPMEPRIMQLRFARYVSEGGIEHANFHALRHTFATRCIESGVDIKSLSELLGHSSTSFTLNRYVHSSMDYKRLQMERLMEGFIR